LILFKYRYCNYLLLYFCFRIAKKTENKQKRIPKQ
jgi:hypothetical protein